MVQLDSASEAAPDKLIWRIVRRVAALCDWSWVRWLLAIMTVIVCYDTLARYLFSSGSAALQELQWHIFSMVFLLGAAHTMRHDGHVRLDLLYRSRLAGPRLRAWVDIIGHLLFLTPFCLLLVWYGTDFSVQAFHHGETSPDPGGLPQRWLVKAAIPIGSCLLLLYAWAETALRLRWLWQNRNGSAR